MMAAENPKWCWSIVNRMHPQYEQGSGFLSTPSSLLSAQHVSGSSSLPSNLLVDHQHNQDFPQSLSKLLLGGLATEEERFGASLFQNKKLENWEEGQLLNPSLRVPVILDVEQDVTQSSQLYGHPHEEFQACKPSWSSEAILVSSPKSCITSSNSNVLDFSINKAEGRNQPLDHSSHQFNSIATGAVSKKARVQSTSTQSPLKVRKEKLGDRIAALHQLVSPFGKTDTASVLLEAIRCIRFLEAQIKALSSPYLGNESGSMRYHQTEIQDRAKDLRSKGLCLVPVSCTHHVNIESESDPDYWTPALGGGF